VVTKWKVCHSWKHDAITHKSLKELNQIVVFHVDVGNPGHAKVVYGLPPPDPSFWASTDGNYRFAGRLGIVPAVSRSAWPSPIVRWFPENVDDDWSLVFSLRASSASLR